jgi:hypothetical protein
MGHYLLAGVALAAGGKVGSLVSRLHQSPNDARHLRENQDMVVRALQVRPAVTYHHIIICCRLKPGVNAIINSCTAMQCTNVQFDFAKMCTEERTTAKECTKTCSHHHFSELLIRA